MKREEFYESCLAAISKNDERLIQSEQEIGTALFKKCVPLLRYNLYFAYKRRTMAIIR